MRDLPDNSGETISATIERFVAAQIDDTEMVIRRAITEQEYQLLLDVAGPQHLVYLTAILTGLRRGDLYALTWGDVHLDAEFPYLLIRAGTKKNRTENKTDLREDLVDELRTSRPENAKPGDRVFAGVLARKGIDALRNDLKRADSLRR